MRVGLISLHYAEYASRLALALGANHEVALFLSSYNAAYELSTGLSDRIDRQQHVHMLRRPRRYNAPFLSLHLASALMAFRPDVIHVQEVNNCASTWTCDLLRYRYPLVLTVHDPLPHTASDNHLLRHSDSCRKRLRDYADRLIVHGDSLRAEWISREPRLAGRIRSVPHGQLGEFDPAHAPLWPGDPVTFLFFGRMEPYKGLESFIDASERIATLGASIHVVVAGAGPELDRLSGRLEAAPWAIVDNRVIPADELAGLFAGATAVVLCYTDATQSGVGAMALAAGCPVIATRVGGLPDVIVDEENGLLIPPCDTGALADAMLRLLKDRDLCNRLISGASDYARRELGWERIAKLTAEVYDEAIAAHGTVARSIDDK